MMKRNYFFLVAFIALVCTNVTKAQTTLFSQNFATGIPATWTNSGTGGTWTYSTTPVLSGVTLATTTVANGYAIFNSDVLGNDLMPENVDLITNSFSCSGQSAVILTFQDVFAQYFASSGTVSVSANNGAWVDVYTVGPGLAQNAINGNPNNAAIDISAQAANQANVRLRFKYQGDYDFWWVVDDILVYAPAAYDAAITDINLSEYTAVPFAQIGSYTPSCEISNLGGSTITGISVATTISNGANATVYTSTLTQGSLAVGASTTLNASSSFTPTAVDFYLLEMIVSINEADGNSTNDTVYWAIEVTDSLFARDAYFLTGNTAFLGGPWFLGAGNNGEMGNKYSTTTATQLISATALFIGGFAIGDQVQAALYSMAGNAPSTLITNSNLLTITAADTPVFVFDIPFPANTMLAANTDYFISVKQFAASSANFGLYSATAQYTPNTSFLKVGTGAWLEVDVAGLGQETMVIWANVYTPPVVCSITDVAAGTQTACVSASNQYTQQVTVTYANEPTTGLLSVNGQTFAITSSPQTVTLTGLTAGGGNVDVSAFFTALATCAYSENNVFIAPVSCACVPMTLSASTTPVLCSQQGAINLSVSGGTGAYSYSWSPGGATTQDISGLTVGSYAVTVTDAQSCSATFNATVANNSYTLGVSVATSSVTNCTSPNGSATATVSGATGGISYAWNPSTFGSGATISNIPSGSFAVIATDANGCTGTGSGSVSNSAGANASVSSLTNVSCNGGANGAISISTSGGTAPITYTWSDQGFSTSIASRTNLTAQAYTITVADAAGCSVVLGPFTLTQPNALVVSLGTSNNATCSTVNNGSIDMNVTGGTPNYTYSWSNSSSTSEDLSGLGAGTYQLTVTDANSCPSVQGPSVTITQPSALSVSINAGSVNNVSCNGGNNGSFTAVATGGTAPYTYTVGATSNSTGIFSGLTASNYTVSVSDANSCPVAIATQAITQPSAVVVSITGGSSSVSCFGLADGAINMNVSGGQSPYTYSWTNTAATTDDLSSLAAGTYTLTATDANGCSGTGAAVVIADALAINTSISSTPASNSASSDGTATVVATGGTGSFSYSWDDANGQTTATAVALASGNYTVEITDGNGCSAIDVIFVDFGSAITELSLNDLNIYPNPTDKNIVVSFELNDTRDIKISFYSTIGNLILSETANVNALYFKSFDVSTLSTGVYFIEISGEEGKVVKKFTISR